MDNIDDLSTISFDWVEVDDLNCKVGGIMPLQWEIDIINSKLKEYVYVIEWQIK